MERRNTAGRGALAVAGRVLLWAVAVVCAIWFLVLNLLFIGFGGPAVLLLYVLPGLVAWIAFRQLRRRRHRQGQSGAGET